MTERTMRFDFGAPAVSAWLAAIGLLVGVHAAVAQTAPAVAATEAPPAFEVASAKLSECKIGDGADVAHGSLAIRCYPLSRIVAWAYGVPAYQVAWAFDVPHLQVNPPEWAARSRFDIFAKAAGAVPEDRVRLMLRTLLAERFKLAVHRDTREGVQLVMTLGKNGHRLKPSESEGPMEVHLDSEGMRDTFKGATMDELIGFFWAFGNLVVNRTGLTGRYDFVLNYAPFMDESDPIKSRAAAAARIDAVRAQTGLAVEKEKVPIDFLVIDRIEKVPTDN